MILEGSPSRNGSSNMLAEEVKKDAKEAGHEVTAISAQLKILIDRFCVINGSIQRKKMKSALTSAAWNSDGWMFDALEAHYHTLVKYLNFQDQGMVLGKGAGHRP